ncbi:amidohydrolase family protein [Kordiimonas sp.]|uniref:amidohydrolase family protein n=1 Tax=Kordiimonas sp. TaxID=1970157 RepID=UPI003A8DA40D
MKFLKFVAKGIGLLLFLAVVVFSLGVLWPLERPEPHQASKRLLIQNASVLDMETGALLPGYSILVEGGVIKAVDKYLAPEGAEVVDASGLYAVPGMFDMHVHTMKMAPELMHPLFIASGVTAVRDMGGCIGIDDAWVACEGDKRAWTSAVNAGTLVAPRYDHVTGLAMDGGSEIPDEVSKSLGGMNADGARARVHHDKALGIDFLKTYTNLPRESYFALADEAKKEGMYLAGHLPFAVSASEAVDAGQRSFEHGFLFIWDCYPGTAALREEGDLYAMFTNEMRQKMIKGHDAQMCADLYARMAASGTAIVPTHTTRKLDAFALDPTYRSDARLKYTPKPLRAIWLDDADGMARRAGAGGQESYMGIYDFGIELTGEAHRAGVDVMLGTDAPDSFAFPGLGIHDEFAHLTRAGLSPIDALRAATTTPAKFLGLEGKAGTLTPGARADIVLLRADPLETVDALKEVETVVLAGAVYTREDLDGMLEAAEGNANSWSMWIKFAWQIIRSPIMLKQIGD